MADIDLSTILANGEYLRRDGDDLIGDIPRSTTVIDVSWFGTSEADLRAAAAEAESQDLPLYLPPGYAATLSAIWSLWAGAHIIGHGATLDLLADGTATGVGVHIGDAPTTVGVNDVIVEGLRVTQSDAAARNVFYGMFSIFGSTRIKLIDVTVGDGTGFTGGEGCGIFVAASTAVELVRPRIGQTYADGIHLSRQTTDSIIDHPVIFDTGDDAIGVVSIRQDAGGPIYGRCARIRITQPTIGGLVGALGSGLNIAGSEHVSVIGGTIATVPGCGIIVQSNNEGGMLYPHANRVVGTAVTDADFNQGSLRVGDATDTTFVGVQVSACEAGAVVINSDNTVFSGCQIATVGTSQFGVYDDAGSSRTLVTGCILNANSGGGVLLTGTGSTEVGNITA